MGETIRIGTTRTQCIGAYLAKPSGAARGGLVVVQEIFGVNAHIRSVVDRFAEQGYVAIAPAFFDHVEHGVELGYDAAGMARGRELVAETPIERALEDIASAASSIASAGKVGVVGYCWGGTVAMLSAIRLGLSAVSYYGARNVNFLHEPLRAATIFHFGEHDKSIPPEAIARHRAELRFADGVPAAQRELEIYTYPADHAFNREASPDRYDAASAALALERTLAFFGRHLGGA
ncbi:MAG: dienelactone hydrolase family protein [Rudaea sp.]|uniref:dienelactone hydrolase family protein n=1 Tax=Rudaea sp. TaxID=2136325 RepID=UPI0039E3116D